MADNIVALWMSGFGTGLALSNALNHYLGVTPRSKPRRAASRVIPPGVPIQAPPGKTLAECDGPCWHQGWDACDCGLFEQLNPHITTTNPHV